MKLDLTGKRVLITGASSGIGEHFARLLAAEGARLALVARRLDLLEGLKAELDCEVEVAALDVTDAEAVERVVAGLDEHFGGLDILINNAGVTRQSSAFRQRVIDWDEVMDTNLRGCWLMANAVARRMGKGSSIINIASILGLRGANQVAPYAISKAGLVHMTKLLALEWARYGIRVNALAPGYLETDINRAFFDTEAGRKMIAKIPQRRLGALSDLDGPLMLLASDAGEFMTGAVIPVDGGHVVNSL